MERYENLSKPFKDEISKYVDPNDIICIWVDNLVVYNYQEYYIIADNGRETKCLRAYKDSYEIKVSMDKEELHKELKGAK